MKWFVSDEKAEGFAAWWRENLSRVGLGTGNPGVVEGKHGQCFEHGEFTAGEIAALKARLVILGLPYGEAIEFVPDGEV